MLKSPFVDLLQATFLCTASVLMFVAPEWAGRSRRPKGRVFRWARRIGVRTGSEERATKVVGILAAHVSAGAELPEPERLRLRLEDHRFSVLSILLVWLIPAAGVGACLVVVLNGDFAHGHPWLMPLMWGMLGAVMVLCETDRRMLARSLPLEHTTLMAVCAVEACRPPGEGEAEVRGSTRGSAVCAGVDDLCAAVVRHVEREPRRTDAVHRARLRAQAQEVVRNLHAAKVRLLEGDQAALGDLCTVIASLLARTVAPAHTTGSTRTLVAVDVLTADPEWQGPPSAHESTGAKLLGSGLFIAGLIGIGWLLPLLHVPEPLTLPLLVIMATAIQRVLKRRLPVPDLPQDLMPPVPPPLSPPAPSPAREAVGEPR
ncbi:hypothetical protein Sros01_72610 [Streptomyces roseochromogenus]|nr:hypothetical protein Sros01_72610 [Streptomyces roseochromogenus]